MFIFTKKVTSLCSYSEKNNCQKVLFIKVARLGRNTFKFRRPFLQNTSRWPLLKITLTQENFFVRPPVNLFLDIMITAWKVSKYGVFFWSVFCRIWTEYGVILHISPYLVRMRENRDQKKLRIWTLFTQWMLILFWPLFDNHLITFC